MTKESITGARIQKVIGRSPDTLYSIAKSGSGSIKQNGAAKKILVKVLPKVLKAAERLQKKAKAQT